MSERPLLLDTCAVLWIEDERRLQPGAEECLQKAQRDGTPIFLSPITAWEIGLLVSCGRLALAIPPASWFRAFLDAGFRLADLTPTLLIESSFLPGLPLRDPADRIIAATARAFGYRLMTRDRPLLALAESGHLNAIAC